MNGGGGEGGGGRGGHVPPLNPPLGYDLFNKVSDVS